MALKIYTERAKVPDGIEIIDFNDSYFDIFTTIEDSDLVRNILYTVDKAHFHSDMSFLGRSKKLGALNKSMLSTGTKILLNIIQHPGVCFNTIECGVNALDFLPLICNGMVIWRLPILTMVPSNKCSIILNDELTFTSFSDLQSYVIDKRGVDL